MKNILAICEKSSKLKRFAQILTIQYFKPSSLVYSEIYMKKIITAFTLLFVSAQFFGVMGQKINRLPQKEIKSAELPATKSPATKNQSEPALSTAQAFSDGNGVLLKWETKSENDLLGFNIYRLDGKGNVKINNSLILSMNLRNTPAAKDGSEYTFFDENGAYQNSYQIEAVYVGKRKAAFNPVVPQYTSDLRNVSNFSSQEFRQTAAQPIIESSKPVLKNGTQLRSRNSGNVADPVNQRWVASQPGVKLTITKEGFYRVSRAQLEAAGFNVNAASNLWQLYFNGEQQAIIVEPTGQYIEFYGAPVEDGIEASTATYFLLVGAANGKRMDTRVVRPVGGTIPANVFYQSQTLKQRASYVPNLLNGEANNFFGDFIGTDPTNITFNLRAIDYSVRKTEIYVTVQGISLAPHSTKVEINGEDMGTIEGSNRDSMQAYITIPTQFLHEGANTLKLTALLGDNDYSLFDSIEVRVQRKYTADSNQLSFYTNDFRSSDLTGFTTSGIRIFDVTDNGVLTALSGFSVYQQDGAWVANIPAYQTRKMYALTDDALKQVDSITPNIPSTIGTPAHNSQFVIISHKNFLTGANAWANYRRAQGMTVEVYDIEDIYDEFNYGKLGSGAIKNFAQYAETQWTTAPGYIMLVGDATYDPHNYYNAPVNYNLVPTKMVDTVYTETGSDDALTDLDDDGLAEIPIGRLPVRTPEQVTLLLNKVTNFEASVAQGFDRGVLCASDLPIGYDFAAICTRVMSELPTSVSKTYVNRADANAATVLLNEMNAGKFFVNYAGHGHTSIWATNGFFSNAAAANLSNSNLSVFTMLTCLNGYFIEPFSTSLSESLIYAPNGGAVVSWASTGLTTANYQETMGRRFYSQLGIGNLTRIGDLINDSKTVIDGGRDVRLSWVLLGDPTLKVR